MEGVSLATIIVGVLAFVSSTISIFIAYLTWRKTHAIDSRKERNEEIGIELQDRDGIIDSMKNLIESQGIAYSAKISNLERELLETRSELKFVRNQLSVIGVELTRYAKENQDLRYKLSIGGVNH